ncbi:hypothetical protein J6590_047353, partial [Homalodisca vitripennis]
CWRVRDDVSSYCACVMSAQIYYACAVRTHLRLTRPARRPAPLTKPRYALRSAALYSRCLFKITSASDPLCCPVTSSTYGPHLASETALYFCRHLSASLHSFSSFGSLTTNVGFRVDF